MALTKLTATRHNIKRAEALARYGINTLDLPHAKPGFNGYGDGTCELCGQKNLKWLFRLHFDEPQALLALAKIECEIDREGAVTINPVGSKCITDWIDALPETQEKLDLLKRWEVEMRKCKDAMKAKVVEDLCSAAGFDSPEAAYEAYGDLLGPRYDHRKVSHARKVLSYYDLNTLRRNARKIQAKTLSRKPCQEWLKLLLKLKEHGPAPAPPPAPAGSATPAAPTMDDEVKKILDDGKAIFDQHSDKLNGYYQATFRDIHSKVSKRGSFVSLRQKNFFQDIVKKMR